MASFLPGAHRDPRIDDSTYWVTRLLHTPADFEIGNEKLYVKGACALGNTLSIDTHVTKLTVGPNKIGPEGALGLADGIGRNRGRLSEFSILDGNEIGPGGCKALVAAVKKNPRIISFSIYDTSIKKEGELIIAHALAELGGICPNFEGFQLAKYCATVFGFPTSYDKKNNAELLFLLRGRPAVAARQPLSFGDTGPSHSDKYDADDYDDDNFITVHIADGSYSSPLDTHTANTGPPKSPTKRAVPLPRHGRPIQPNSVPASPQKNLKQPMPISNPFTSGAAAEGTAIRALENNKNYTIPLPK